jgi:predicted nuclease of predicted toxin-antitoxin system
VKALLDEQLCPRITELLQDRGHDVQAVVDRPDLAGRSDRVIFEIAAAEGRAVITNNVKDFRPLAAERLARGESHAGLILLPSTRMRTRGAVEMLANAIEQIFREHPDGMPAAERWIPPTPSAEARAGG